jgi:hypothetical protein
LFGGHSEQQSGARLAFGAGDGAGRRSVHSFEIPNPVHIDDGDCDIRHSGDGGRFGRRHHFLGCGDINTHRPWRGRLSASTLRGLRRCRMSGQGDQGRDGKRCKKLTRHGIPFLPRV